MATFCKLSLLFLMVSYTCYQIQARESKFFSKYHHLGTTNYVTIPSTNPKLPFSSPSPSPSPITSQISGIPASAPTGPHSPAPISGADYSPAPAPMISGADYSPAPAPAENDALYGLYAKETNDEEDEFSTENAEEFSNRGSPSTYSNGRSSTYNNRYSNSNNGFRTSDHESYRKPNNGYDFTGGYKSEPQGMSNNGFRTSDHESYRKTNNGYDFTGGYGYKSEPQGMSDTRLQNEGNYYYDLEQQNRNPTGYKNNDEEGYNDVNYNKSKYEFDSMEEFEKQEGFADVEQEFNP